MSALAQRSLRHPAFLGSLVLLVVNDHLLKGGDLPGWITGKLSDLAGLVVAPVVLAAALRAAHGRAHRAIEGVASRGTAWHTRTLDAIAMALVTLVFVTMQLWQPAADALAACLGALGVPSRFWADPTDLVALAVLPLTWHVLGRDAAAGPEPVGSAVGSATPGRRVLGRVAFGLGVAACIATSPRPTSWSTSAYLLNDTDTQRDVRVRWASLDLACDALGTRTLSTLVSPDVLTSGVTFRVAPGATIPLDDWAALAARGGVDAGFGAPRPPTSFGDGCVIGLIATDGLPDTLVVWPTVVALSVPTRASDGTLPMTGRVTLSGETSIALSTSADLRAEAYDARFMPASCALDPELGTSEPSAVEGPSFEITSRSTTPDGCVRLDFQMGVRAQPFFVCAPEALVPFEVGDFVRVDASDDLGVARVALVDAAHTLVILRARERSETGVVEGGVTLSVGAADRCLGARLDCGSFVVPREPRISGAAAGEDPRGVVTRTSATGRAMQIQVSRAELVLAGAEGCSEGRERAGSLLDAVILYE